MIALLKTGGGGESSGRDGWDKLGRASLAVARSDFAMVSVSTLWLVLTANLLASELMWAYVIRRYPKLGAARYSGAGSLRPRRKSIRPSATTCRNLRKHPTFPI